MPTELGAASIKVVLNHEEAKRQIAELRKEIQQGRAAGGGSAGPTPDSPAHVLKSPRVQAPRVSGDLPEDPDLGNGTVPTLRPPSAGGGSGLAQALYQDVLRYMRLDRMRKFGQVHVAQAAEEASVMGRASTALSKAVGTDLAGAVGLAGGIYAGISSFSKAAPYAAEILGAVTGLPDEVIGALNDLKNMVNNLESRVSNFAKATGEATEIWTDGARITGQLPDWLYYYGQAYDVGVAEDDLRKKFDHFKRMEVAGAIGKSLDQAVSGSLSR